MTDSDSEETDVDAKASSGSSFCFAAAEAADSADTDADAKKSIKCFRGASFCEAPLLFCMMIPFYCIDFPRSQAFWISGFPSISPISPLPPART